MIEDIAYVTRFNPAIFPRPLFMKKAIPELNIYLLSIRQTILNKGSNPQLMGNTDSIKKRKSGRIKTSKHYS